jgi:hypothetical protein
VGYSARRGYGRNRQVANMPRRISTFATLQHAGRDKAAKRLIVTLVSFAALFHGVDAHLASYLPLDPAMEFARSEGLKERWGSLRRIEAAMEPKGWLTGLIHRARSRTSAIPLTELARRMSNGSSRPEESHPRALPDPCVNLSIHTAPDARPFPWHSCQ